MKYEVNVAYDDQPEEISESFVAILEKIGCKVTEKWDGPYVRYTIDSDEIEEQLFRLKSLEH